MGRKGFTLIELIVVLAILAILAAIALPNYMAIRCKACEAEAKEILGEVRKLAWGYYIENGNWPSVADLMGGWGLEFPAQTGYTYSGSGGTYTATNATANCTANCPNNKNWTMICQTDGSATLN
jgi:prepilin-type N-terminal cleavage/methylation domain-containing protein